MTNPIPGQPAPDPPAKTPGHPRSTPLAQAIGAVAQTLDDACAALTDRQPELHAARVRDLARRAIRAAGLHLHITECETPWLQFADSGRCTARVSVLAILRFADSEFEETPYEKVKASGFATRYSGEDAARAAAAQAETQALAQFFGHHAAPIDEQEARNRYEARLERTLRQARDEAMRTMTAAKLKLALAAMPERLEAVAGEAGAERLAAVLAEHGADRPKASLLDMATAWFELETLCGQWKLQQARRAAE